MYDRCLIDFGLIFEGFGAHFWMEISFKGVRLWVKLQICLSRMFKGLAGVKKMRSTYIYICFWRCRNPPPIGVPVPVSPQTPLYSKAKAKQCNSNRLKPLSVILPALAWRSAFIPQTRSISKLSLPNSFNQHKIPLRHPSKIILNEKSKKNEARELPKSSTCWPGGVHSSPRPALFLSCRYLTA